MYTVKSVGFGYIATLKECETLEDALKFCNNNYGGLTIEKIRELGIDVIEIKKDNELVLGFLPSAYHVIRRK